MKVELEKIRLGMTAIEERICVGTLENNQTFRHKHDVTNDFIKAVIDWCGGYRRTITSSDGSKYEISCKKIEHEKKQLNHKPNPLEK